MSNTYRHGDRVPTEALSARLAFLAHVVTLGKEAVSREFVMRIPAELDFDADLVLSAAGIRLKEYKTKIESLEKEIEKIQKDNYDSNFSYVNP